MNSEDRGYKVEVQRMDGSWEEFRAFDSYDTMAQGRMLVWQDVILYNQRLDFYSIPVSDIKTIKEIDLNK